MMMLFSALKLLIEAGMVLFSTPMHYFGMLSQLRAVIDRFYAVDKRIIEKILALVTAASARAKARFGACAFLPCRFIRPKIRPKPRFPVISA